MLAYPGQLPSMPPATGRRQGKEDLPWAGSAGSLSGKKNPIEET